MEPNTAESIPANSHHHPDIPESLQAMKEGHTHEGEEANIKKNLGSLVKGNDTRKRDTAIKMDMNANRLKEKGRKDNTAHTIGQGIQSVSNENPPSERKVGKWRHRRVIFAPILIFTNDY